MEETVRSCVKPRPIRAPKLPVVGEHIPSLDTRRVNGREMWHRIVGENSPYSPSKAVIGKIFKS